MQLIKHNISVFQVGLIITITGILLSILSISISSYQATASIEKMQMEQKADMETRRKKDIELATKPIQLF